MKFSPVRNNNDRRGRNVRSRYVSDFEMNGADYAPQPKRRKKGECPLDTLRLKEEVSGLFLKPVSKKDAPDYFDIVKPPMDLSTIRDKVRKVEYRNREQFRSDVWQIQLNAHLYRDQLAEAEKGIDR
ncbi:hypothetical protein IGI04_022102 [Brassica rapa subsp. trilocularis]|uniref:Bromo domain-containing protein n=1 Tax=Brassica rapa subsp. trilocularis TaxID=1813537 RepID=A0ABQ7M019_BRACM|nr:hypothetical protein IGI04_022102 [Brassica rapa subsp. trilocularis]